MTEWPNNNNTSEQATLKQSHIAYKHTLSERKHNRMTVSIPTSNQSVLKEIHPECSLEGLMLNLKLQYFSHPMQRANSLEKTLMLGKVECRMRRGWQKMKWPHGITDSMAVNLGKLREMVRDREVWHVAVHGIPKSHTQLGNWTTASGGLFSSPHSQVRKKERRLSQLVCPGSKCSGSHILILGPCFLKLILVCSHLYFLHASVLSHTVMSHSLWPHELMGFPRQEYWSGLTFPPPGDLSDPEIEPVPSVSSAWAGRSFYCWNTWEAPKCNHLWKEAQEGGDISIPIGDSCRYSAETSTILSRNYCLIKNKYI